MRSTRTKELNNVQISFLNKETKGFDISLFDKLPQVLQNKTMTFLSLSDYKKLMATSRKIGGFFHDFDFRHRFAKKAWNIVTAPAKEYFKFEKDVFCVLASSICCRPDDCIITVCLPGCLIFTFATIGLSCAPLAALDYALVAPISSLIDSEILIFV